VTSNARDVTRLLRFVEKVVRYVLYEEFSGNKVVEIFALDIGCRWGSLESFGWLTNAS
jgi:hypothetical protein